MYAIRDMWYRAKMSDTKLVVGYIRVSTDEQAEQRLGLDAQRERIAAYCTARGWVLAGVIEDAGVSAKTLERQGMQQVLHMMQSRAVDAVVALKLDRLTRSMVDLHKLLQTAERTGVALVSVSETLDTGSAAGRLMVNVLAAIAEWERETIGERTSQAMSVKRRRGERVGRHATIGSAVGEGARQCGEVRTLDVLRAELLAGTASLRTLAKKLQAAGCVSRAGTAYTPSSVQAMVRTIAERDSAVRDVMAQQKAQRQQRDMQPRLDAVRKLIAA